MRSRIRDEARFTEEDCAAVVMASFACRVCLAAADLVTLVGGPGVRVATSICSECGTLNRVTLSDAQAHQVRTLQRGNTFVHFAPEYW
jgi:hypothetical protein